MPELSVLIPLTDSRGDAMKHVRTWTHGQTVDRERYQVVLVSDGEDPAGDEAVAALLEPHDVLHTCRGGLLIDLWNAAAERAEAPWLLITENHCEAERDTVERAVEGIRDAPELEAASLEHGHLTATAAGKQVARWFDQVYEEWFRPGEWRRLNPAGFVIRRDAFDSAGRMDARYGLFSAPLLAARLDQRGAQVSHLPEARILHVHVEELDEHHHHSAEYARGECEARGSLDPEFAERYFGHQHLLFNRRQLDTRVARQLCSVLSREAATAAVRSPRDLPWLLRELGSRLPVAAAGAQPNRLATRVTFAWSERAAGLEALPSRRRYGHYLRAQDRVVKLAQLEWIEANPDGDGPGVPEGSHGAAQLVATAVAGLHGLERHDGRWFRWSEPVLNFRLDGSAGGGELRIDSGGLRGSPAAVVSGAYVGTRRLPRTSLREEGSLLVVELPADGAADLTLLCRPVRPQPAADERRLGLPLFSVELR